MLLGVALEDPKAFQNTLSRVMELAGAAPKKREFQGTTIYDFEAFPTSPPPAAPTSSSVPRARSAWRSPRTRCS